MAKVSAKVYKARSLKLLLIILGIIVIGAVSLFLIKNFQANSKSEASPVPTQTCVPMPKCNVKMVRGQDGTYYCPTADLKPGVTYCKVYSIK